MRNEQIKVNLITKQHVNSMTVKEHYDNHLGNFYSWYTGDFNKNKEAFRLFCIENTIKPQSSKIALDLGAGNGIQSIALAELGFKVTAIDFNEQLISELKSRIGSLPVTVLNDDIRNIRKHSVLHPELIICCGDTLTHLDSVAEINQLIKDIYEALLPGGRVILTFRDYSHELADASRFIPVKSDSRRILTCFIEYFPDKIRVTDLLHELENDRWVQKASSYYKTRFGMDNALAILKDSGFKIILGDLTKGIITLIGEKIPS
jgi:2-polyprenyl-3-methyl-5-hydroxy-6-metoxy-1,4-benzoquinol methylase